MKDIIIEKLKSIESENHIKILYACESGSRAWGFPSPDSDFDVRFIYIHKTAWYLTIKPGKDFIEEPLSVVFDINGWDIIKFLQHIAKSNAVMWEWLTSPIIYFQVDDFRNTLTGIAGNYFSPLSCCYHYLSIVRNMIEENLKTDTIKIKKYFYILRPLFAAMWIVKFKNIPPMNFHELL
jgi:uncharacterized protein